jgi:guanine nucleotide-binding protein G(i) subunit alpha
MKESIKLFQEVLHHNRFEEKPVILVLNRKDLFIQKLKRIPLNSIFPTFTGEEN